MLDAVKTFTGSKYLLSASEAANQDHVNGQGKQLKQRSEKASE